MQLLLCSVLDSRRVFVSADEIMRVNRSQLGHMSFKRNSQYIFNVERGPFVIALLEKSRRALLCVYSHSWEDKLFSQVLITKCDMSYFLPIVSLRKKSGGATQ
jgi:hypothetical protein